MLKSSAREGGKRQKEPCRPRRPAGPRKNHAAQTSPPSHRHKCLHRAWGTSRCPAAPLTSLYLMHMPRSPAAPLSHCDDATMTGSQGEMTSGVSRLKAPAQWRPPRGRGQEEAVQLHQALKPHPNDCPEPGPGHCDGQAEEEDKVPLMSTAVSPDTLCRGRLPAAASDPRETPSLSTPTRVPVRGDVTLGQAQLPAAHDTGVPNPALAGVTFVTSGEDAMLPSWWEMPLLGPVRETTSIPGGRWPPPPHHTQLPSPPSHSMAVPVP